MKKLALICAIVFCALQQSYASHLMGGEITWKCQGNGDFVFRLTVYRDCNGIPFGPPVALDVLDNPALTQINMNLISQTDISPLSACITCTNTMGYSGAVEEFIFESNVVHLTGTPPASGWKFIWYSCCRNAAIDNLQNGGSLGFTVRAIMYDVQNLPVTSVCNSSPQFDEKAVTAMGNNVPIHYVPLAHDDEMDSLSFQFAQPYDSYAGSWPPASCPYGPNYSVNSPLPGTAQNPLNQPVTLDPLTGDMNFLSVTSGDFVAVVKVSEYRCGELISEVFREIQLAIMNQLPIDSVSIFNTAPSVIPPFVDALGNPSYSDTVFAGDYVNANITFDEFDTLELSQKFKVMAYGNEFGAGFTDSSSGCLIPPCVTANPPLPLDSQMTFASTVLSWQTTTDHLGLNYPCAYLPNTYTFLFSLRDDYCIVHAFEYQRVNITVMPVTPKPGVVNTGAYLESPLMANRSYQWYKNRWPVIGATANTFSPTSNGSYQLRVIDATGEGNYSEPVYINYTGVSEEEYKQKITIGPNPNKGRFNISNIRTLQNITVTITDMDGRIVYLKQHQHHNGELPLWLNLKNGVYTLCVTAENYLQTERLVINGH